MTSGTDNLADQDATSSLLTFAVNTLHSQAYASLYEHAYRLGVDISAPFWNPDVQQIPIRAVSLDLMRTLGPSTKCQFLHFLEPDTDHRAVWASFCASTDVPPHRVVVAARFAMTATRNAAGRA